MILTYNVENHIGLKQSIIFGGGECCMDLKKDAFDGGIKFIERSEHINNVLSKIPNKTTTLTNFILGFEKLV